MAHYCSVLRRLESPRDSPSEGSNSVLGDHHQTASHPYPSSKVLIRRIAQRTGISHARGRASAPVIPTENNASQPVTIDDTPCNHSYKVQPVCRLLAWLAYVSVIRRKSLCLARNPHQCTHPGSQSRHQTCYNAGRVYRKPRHAKVKTRGKE